MICNSVVPTDQVPIVYVIAGEQQVRESIAAIASTQGWRCAGFAASGEFFASPSLSRPGCLILDGRLENEDSLEVLQRIQQQPDSLPTLIITDYADIPIAIEFMRRGAVMLLEKPYSIDLLVTNIRQAFEQDYQSLHLQQRMRKLRKCQEQLTDQQQQIIDMVLQGCLNKRIANLLQVSQRTIENKRAAILEIYKVNNAVELATKITEYRSYLAMSKPPAYRNDCE